MGGLAGTVALYVDLRRLCAGSVDGIIGELRGGVRGGELRGDEIGEERIDVRGEENPESE